MAKYFYFLLLLFFITNYAIGQEYHLKGLIQNEKNESLVGSTIILRDVDNKTIGYALSENSGQFSLTFKLTADKFPITISISHIGYTNYISKILKNETSNPIKIKLVANSNQLDEIEIKTPISRRQDTTSYQVDKFAKEEDRSIGDVLKRLPGITIDTESGAIYHNDKKIKNLYIQGDDLMSGKYGLATRTIKKEMIKSVDVINHHQPIKVLEKKFLTDDIAINLVLKDESSWKKGGQVKIGGGIPSLYNSELTGLILNSTFKAINNVGINNSSVNYRSDLNQIGANTLNENLSPENVNIMLDLGIKFPNSLVAKNYYDNISKIINLNNVLRLKKDLTLKINTSFFKDKYVQNQSSYTDNIIDSAHIIRYEENSIGHDKLSLFSFSANVQSNKTKGFINNTLNIKTEENNNYANTFFNNDNFKQKYKNNSFNISNDFNWIPQISTNGIFEVRSYLSYDESNKGLFIGPDYYPLFIDSSQTTSAENYQQNVKIPRLYADNYVSYRTFSEKFSQEYKLGFLIDYIDLESELRNDYSSINGFENNSSWLNKTLYFTPSIQYKSGRFRILSKVPIIYQRINFEQKMLNEVDNYKNIFLLPDLNFEYAFDGINTVFLSYKLINNSSHIQNLFAGRILQNFRNYISNNAGFDIRNTHRFELVFKKENPIKMYFSNIALSYALTKRNSIMQKVTNEAGESYSLVPFSNYYHSYDIRNTYSKYFYKLGFTTTITSRIGYMKTNLLINSNIIHSNTITPELSLSAVKRINESLEIKYIPSISYIINTLKHPDHRFIRNNQLAWRQNISSFIKISKFLQTNIDFNYISFIQENQPTNTFYLFDIKNTIPLKIAKQKIDINLNCLNLFNIKSYSQNYLSDNIISSQTFHLRGRMISIDASLIF